MLEHLKVTSLRTQVSIFGVLPLKLFKLHSQLKSKSVGKVKIEFFLCRHLWSGIHKKSLRREPFV